MTLTTPVMALIIAIVAMVCYTVLKVTGTDWAAPMLYIALPSVGTAIGTTIGKIPTDTTRSTPVGPTT